MSNIKRTTTRAEGWITPQEKKQLDKHAKLWIERIMRTKKIDPKKIIPAIKGLYKVSWLKEPKVIIVPSPLVMRLAGWLSAGILYLKEKDISIIDTAINVTTDEAINVAIRETTYESTDTTIDNAIDVATYNATFKAADTAINDTIYYATHEATREAIKEVTDDAIREAVNITTRDAVDMAIDRTTDDTIQKATYEAADTATRDATYMAIYNATRYITETVNNTHWLLWVIQKFLPGHVNFALWCIWLSRKMQQWGNMRWQYDSYLTATRDVLWLTGLKCRDKYKHWEECAIEWWYRLMHKDFCMVSDFPKFIKTDNRNRPHAEDWPSHLWRDWFSIYHLQWVRISDVDLYWKIVKDEMTPQDIFKIENTELRRIAYEYMDKTKMKKLKGYKVLNKAKDWYGNKMQIIEFKVEDFEKPFKYYQCICPSSWREYFLETKENTCEKAKAKSFGLEQIQWDIEA